MIIFDSFCRWMPKHVFHRLQFGTVTSTMIGHDWTQNDLIRERAQTKDKNDTKVWRPVAFYKTRPHWQTRLWLFCNHDHSRNQRAGFDMFLTWLRFVNVRKSFVEAIVNCRDPRWIRGPSESLRNSVQFGIHYSNGCRMPDLLCSCIEHHWAIFWDYWILVFSGFARCSLRSDEE